MWSNGIDGSGVPAGRDGSGSESAIRSGPASAGGRRHGTVDASATPAPALSSDRRVMKTRESIERPGFHHAYAYRCFVPAATAVICLFDSVRSSVFEIQ